LTSNRGVSATMRVGTLNTRWAAGTSSARMTQYADRTVEIVDGRLGAAGLATSTH
jgi:hypothetical protein